MTPLFHYLRRGRQPFAMLLGIMQDDQIHISWSRCHKKDQFCKKTAKIIAGERLSQPPLSQEIPLPKKEIENFKIRCIKYFKPNINNLFTIRG